MILQPIEWLFMQLGKLCFWLGWTVMGAIQHSVITLFKILTGAKSAHTGKETQEQKDLKKESQRIAECQEVANHYALTQGHIARECFSRDELEQLIKDGITRDKLAEVIESRIQATPSIILGVHSRNPDIQIKLPLSVRDRHAYIIGKSGSGKTTFLRGCIMQDLAQGNGIGVLAPEAEFLTDEILPYIPEERLDDVVYVNPADTERPVPINPLHVDEGEDIDKKVEDFIAIFKRAVGETGLRMDDILNNTLYALMTRSGSTLLDIEPFLNRVNPAFRNEVLKTADERVQAFFTYTYPGMDKNAHIPVVSRINAFLRRQSVRSLLCQPGRSLDFRKAIDSGKILLFNVSDGILGQQTAQLLGELLVSKIQMAVFSRANSKKTMRRQFYLYLDEFQAFVGANSESYSMLLERGRKYGFGMVCSHQQTGQIPPSLLKQILGNVATIISFNVSYEDAKQLSREYVFSYNGQTDCVPPEAFVNQKTGEAIGKVGKSVFPLRTYLVDQKPDYMRAEEVIERSRQNYGVSLRDSWQPPKKPEIPDINNDDDDDPSKVF